MEYIKRANNKKSLVRNPAVIFAFTLKLMPCTFLNANNSREEAK